MADNMTEKQSQQINRKCSPEFIYPVWKTIRNILSLKKIPDGARITKDLVNEFDISSSKAFTILNDMVDDGFLKVAKSGRKRDICTYYIPDFKTITVPTLSNKYDWYCYECKKPGELIECLDCTRVFHKYCARVDLDKSVLPLKEPIPDIFLNMATQIYGHSLSNNNQLHNDSALNNDESLESLENKSNTEDDTLNTPISKTDASNILSLNEYIVTISSTNETSTSNFETEDSKSTINLKQEHHASVDANFINKRENEDVLFAGVIRLPDKRFAQRVSSPYKAEIPTVETNIDILKYCTVCRLMKQSTFNLPANTSITEINYLLSFAFNRVRTWLSQDTFSAIESSSLIIPKADLKILKSLLLHKITTTEKVAQKLEQKNYESLTEFKCDFLDIQHCIGIICGVDSSEFEAAKYLLMDGMREVAEMIICTDCYRHSNEKRDPLWFCQPCSIRHELVFAKQIGYSYWPAKVLNVVNDQYDVRFFGAQHARAAINISNVKPIETDLQTFKIKKTQGFTKAMAELAKHQELSSIAPEIFSFDSQRNNIPAITTNDKTYITKKHSPIINKENKKNKQIKTPISAKAVKSKPEIKISLRLKNQENLYNNNKKNKINKASTITRKSPATVTKKKETSTLPKHTGSVPRKSKRTASLSRNSNGEESAESTISDYIAVNSKKRKITQSVEETPRKPQQNPTISLKFLPKVVLNAIDSTYFLKEQNSSPTSTENNEPTSTQPDLPQIQSRLETTVYSPIEKLRMELDACKTTEKMKIIALDTLKLTIEQHEKEINMVKLTEWCVNCKKQAIFHCCWCHAYCSKKCQVYHWNNGHKIKHIQLLKNQKRNNSEFD